MATGRIITFYPFFLLGSIVTNETIELNKNKFNKNFSIITLILIALIIWIVFINIKIPLDAVNMRGAYIEYTSNLMLGLLIRIAYYVLALLSMLSISILIKNKKSIFSTFGRNSMLI